MPVPKGFTEKKVRGVTCARGSYRTKKLSKSKRLIVCCPKGPGHWKRGRCRVGMRAKAVLKRRR